MGNRADDLTGILSKEFSDDFQCCICLDIFYKPIVLACGHVACFWCVHKSMNSRKASKCPICRNQYHHFPSICWLLNFVLLKLYPSAYKRRELEIAELETKTGPFSPQFEYHLSQLHSSKELSVSCSSSQSQLNLPSSVEEGEPSSLVKDSSAAISADTNTLPHLSCEASESVGPTENSLAENMFVFRSCEQVRIADVLCGLCKQLLYKPLVLNCGHVYCESCIINSSNMINCQACQCVQPNGFPKVCLVLNHYLEDQFSVEYTARRSAVLKGFQCQKSLKLMLYRRSRNWC